MIGSWQGLVLHWVSQFLLVRVLQFLDFTSRRVLIILFTRTRFTSSRFGAVVRALASHQCVPGSIPGPGVLFVASRGFSPGTPVFPSPQNQHFQIPIRSWNARTFLNEFLWTPWCSVSKQITFTFTLHMYIGTCDPQGQKAWSAFGRNETKPCHSRETRAVHYNSFHVSIPVSHRTFVFSLLVTERSKRSGSCMHI